MFVIVMGLSLDSLFLCPIYLCLLYNDRYHSVLISTALPSSEVEDSISVIESLVVFQKTLLQDL